jgi:predicted translin family RNA/ssDNA-binding protein
MRSKSFINGIRVIINMLKEFEDIRKKLEMYDSKREELIKRSRDLLKISKQVIYSVYRGDMKEASGLVDSANKVKKDVDKIADFDKKMLFEGSYSEACQEYSEAIAYFYYTKSKKLPSIKELNVDHEDYLMGICDLTGELTRMAVAKATKREFKTVEEIKEFVEAIYGEFLKFDLRNGNLRKKYDALKWNLKRLEEVMYDTTRR